MVSIFLIGNARGERAAALSRDPALIELLRAKDSPLWAQRKWSPASATLSIDTIPFLERSLRAPCRPCESFLEALDRP